MLNIAYSLLYIASTLCLKKMANFTARCAECKARCCHHYSLLPVRPSVCGVHVSWSLRGK